jgi:hypothetical protein
MSGVDEAIALEHVREVLTARFPTVDPTTVKAVVHEVHASLDGPVRDYIPLLVERLSRDRLRALASSASSPSRARDPQSLVSG